MVPAPVLILMATFNGAQFLPEQLDGIARQTHRDWRLLVSDDGSQDGTRAILEGFRASRPAGQVRLVAGPGSRGAAGGPAANFLSLLQRAEPQEHGHQGTFLAFCDQDDAWDADHLARALGLLAHAGTPLALCGCRMRICDADLRPRTLSPLPRRPLGFRNALLQNVLSGNTMVASPEAARLLQAAAGDGVEEIPAHDWWAYQIVTGAGGQALHDAHPSVAYRQHDTNAVGAAPGGLQRALRHLRGEPRRWAARNIAALRASAARLTPENRRIFTQFVHALETPFPLRIVALRSAGVYHQSPQARAAFWASVALGRF